MDIITVSALDCLGNPKLKLKEKCEHCDSITIDELEALFSKNIPNIDTVVSLYNQYAPKFHIDNCLRKAHFWAQIREEAGPRLNVKDGESLIYSAARLYHKSNFKNTKGKTVKPAPFAKFWGKVDLCLRYGKTLTSDDVVGIPDATKNKTYSKHKADQVSIANIAYAGRLGNGDASSGDGWRFRGGGFIQLTGRSQYETINKTIKKYCPDFNEYITFDNINNVKESLVSAMAYWIQNNLNTKADKGYEKSVVDSITRIINLKTESYAQRYQHFIDAVKCFNVKECSYVND